MAPTGRPAQADAQQGGGDADGHGRDTRVVDLRRDVQLGNPEMADDDEQRDQPHRQRDVEQPPPTRHVGDPTADQRPGHLRGTHHRTHVALVLAALPGRDQIAQDGLRQGHQDAHADPLDRPGEDQEVEAHRQARQRRAHHEDDQPDDVEAAASEDVGQLAADRGDDGGDEHHDGGQPSVVGHPAQVGDDPRDGRADDGLAD